MKTARIPSPASPLPASDSFSIQRESVTLARVYLLAAARYPEPSSSAPRDVKDTTIVIREPSPGQFTATAAEPDWIRIVAVTQP